MCAPARFAGVRASVAEIPGDNDPETILPATKSRLQPPLSETSPALSFYKPGFEQDRMQFMAQQPLLPGTALTCWR